MLPLTNTFDVNEGLFVAIESGRYENVLKYLMEGARATKISASCGRTAVGQAALLGDAEILELLLQSCEEPDLDLFRNSKNFLFLLLVLNEVKEKINNHVYAIVCSIISSALNGFINIKILYLKIHIVQRMSW